MDVKNVYEVVGIRMIKGDTMKFSISFDTATTLASADFTAKNIDTGTVVFHKSLSDGITQNQGGSYTVRVAPADTSSLAEGRYSYDLQIGIGEDIYTLLIGALDIFSGMTE